MNKTDSVQKSFKSQVDKLCQVIEEFGNPFAESHKDLIVLDTQDIVDESVVTTVLTIHDIGKKQFQTFMTERVIERQTSLFQPIKANKFLFSCPRSKKNSNNATSFYIKTKLLFFSQLYLSYQVREGNLEEFFAHENQNFPASILHNGKLRIRQKSQLLQCLESTLSDQVAPVSPDVHVKILDGAAIVNILKPEPNTTFEEYATNVLLQNDYISVDSANQYITITLH